MRAQPAATATARSLLERFQRIAQRPFGLARVPEDLDRELIRLGFLTAAIRVQAETGRALHQVTGARDEESSRRPQDGADHVRRVRRPRDRLGVLENVVSDLVCRLLLEKKKQERSNSGIETGLSNLAGYRHYTAGGFLDV